MIVSLRSLDQGVLFEGEAMALHARTTSGDITVLNHHRPLMTELVPGHLRVEKQDGSFEKITIAGGFLEVNRSNQVLVLLD